MSFQFRPFDPAQDTQPVVNLYNDVFGPLRPYYSWPLSVERFTDKVLSHGEFRPEGLLLAFAGERLIGCLLASLREQPLLDIDHAAGAANPAFISFVAVMPGYRRQGVGRALLAGATEFALAHGRRSLKVSANPMAPLAFTIGVQEDWHDARAFLSAGGFHPTDAHQNMVRSIIGYRVEEPISTRIAQLQAEGYQCRAYREQDYPALLALLDDHGWAYWHLDMLSKVGRWTISRPFMETCFLDCATEQIYGPDEIGVVLKDGVMLSFCAQTINRDTGKTYLGPMLTAAPARGLGLGTVSLQLSLELAAHKGAILCDLWTGADEHMSHYYGKSGFRRVMEWRDYEWELG